MSTITTATAADLASRIERGEPLADEEWLLAVQEVPTDELLRLAEALRWRLHPEPAVSYVIDRNVNYSNVCSAVCTFCAFYRQLPGEAQSFGLIFLIVGAAALVAFRAIGQAEWLGRR